MMGEGIDQWEISRETNVWGAALVEGSSRLLVERVADPLLAAAAPLTYIFIIIGVMQMFEGLMSTIRGLGRERQRPRGRGQGGLARREASRTRCARIIHWDSGSLGVHKVRQKDIIFVLLNDRFGNAFCLRVERTTK